MTQVLVIDDSPTVRLTLRKWLEAAGYPVTEAADGMEGFALLRASKEPLVVLLDYQMPSNTAWGNGERLVNEILRDPDDLWAVITSISEQEWQERWPDYRLHRFPAAHRRLWTIGKVICERYAGDARRIWEHRDARATLEALWELGAGDQNFSDDSGRAEGLRPDNWLVERCQRRCICLSRTWSRDSRRHDGW